MNLKPKSNHNAPSSSAKPKASWRSASNRPAPAGKLWSKQAKKESLVLSRGFKLFVSLTALLGLTIFFILFNLRDNTPPTVLVFPVVNYSYPWGPNAWAAEDAAYLKKTSKTAQFSTLIAEDRQEQSWKDWLERHLRSTDFKAGGPGGTTLFGAYQSLIVYISGHVDINESGTPCILFPRNESSAANATIEDNWFGVEPIPLVEVVGLVAEGMKPRKKNWWNTYDHRKLIVLDIGKLPPRLHLGNSNESLHDSIRKAIESINDPDLSVLLSCGPNERAWTLPERGGSIFGLHFANALAGAADSKGDGRGRISMKELEKYLVTRVDQTARAQRAVSQKPVVYYANGNATSGKSFEIAFSGGASSTKPPIAESALSIDNSDDIDDAWNRFITWQSKMISLDPWIVSEARNRLSNVESLLLAGPSYSPSLNNELNSVNQILLSRQPVYWPVTVELQSRAVEIDAIYDALPQEDRSQAIAWLEDTPQSDGKPIPESPSLEWEQAFPISWHWMEAKQELTPKAWLRVEALLSAAKKPRSSNKQTRDVLLLNSLRGGIQNALDKNNESAARMVREIPLILKSHRKLEELNRTNDPRLCLWQDAQNRLHAEFFNGLDFWFLATNEGLIECNSRLSSLTSTLTNTPLVDTARTDKRNQELAWSLHDEQAMILPNLDWIARNESWLFEKIDTPFQELGAIADGLSKLHDALILSAGDAQTPNPDRLRDINEQEKRWLNLKRQLLRPAEQLAVSQVTLEPSSRRNMVLWLQQPIDLPSTTRSVIRSKLVTYLNDKSKENPPETESAAEEVSDLEPLNPTMATSSDNLSNRWWQSISIERSASDSVDEVTRNIECLGKNAALNRARIASLQTAFTNGATQSVSKFTKDSGKSAEARNETWRIAWSSRLLAPFITLNTAKHLCSTRHHWAIASQLSMISLAKQSLADFWVQQENSQEPSKNEFYATLASNFLRKAETFPALTQAIEGGLSNNALTRSFESLLKDKVVASTAWERTFWNSLPDKPIDEASLTLSFNTPLIDANTLLSGKFPDSPLIVSKAKPANQIRIDVTKLNGTSTPLTAFLRGRTSQRAIEVAGVTIEPEVKLLIDQSNEVKIRVRSEVAPRQILFILDCSSSFFKTDHRQAKQTLLNILNELPEKSTQVGLIVFGHSTIWSDVSGATSFKNNLRLPNRTPENDIDLVVNIQPLSEQTKSDFEKQLDLVDPFGFTPLFRSIDQGREELVKVKATQPGFDQHLVVITDGADNVYTDKENRTVSNSPSSRKFQFGKAPSTVKVELQKANVKLHVIKFKYTDPKGTDSGIVQLADTKFVYDADNASRLEQAFKAILGLRSFIVSKDGTKLSENRLGDTTIGTTVDRSTKLELQVGNDTERANLVAQGGDFFDAGYDPNNKTYQFYRLDEKTFQQSIVVNNSGNDKTRWKVSLLPDETKGLRKSLRFAIQPDGEDQKLPPMRPTKTWIEMKVLPKGSKALKSVFLSDVQWENFRESPVFRIPLEQADAKEVRIWLAFSDNRSDETFLSRWTSKENELSKYLVSPDTNQVGNNWGVKFTPKTNDRIRIAVAPVTSGTAKPPRLRSITYTLGLVPTQSYIFSEEPGDLRIRYELMPAEDRGNTDGWLTTDWFRIDGQK